MPKFIATRLRVLLDAPAAPPLKFGPWAADFAAAESFGGADSVDLAEGNGRIDVPAAFAADFSPPTLAGVYLRVFNDYSAHGIARVRAEFVADFADGSQLAVVASEPAPRASDEPRAAPRPSPLTRSWHQFLTRGNRRAVRSGGTLSVEVRRDAGRLVLAITAAAAGSPDIAFVLDADPVAG